MLLSLRGEDARLKGIFHQLLRIGKKDRKVETFESALTLLKIS